jgi:hypothetical protein
MGTPRKQKNIKKPIKLPALPAEVKKEPIEDPRLEQLRKAMGYGGK